MTDESLARRKNAEGMVYYKSVSIIYFDSKKLGCCAKSLPRSRIKIYRYKSLMEYLYTERSKELGFGEMVAKQLPESLSKLYYREKAAVSLSPQKFIANS